jgi:hypothetical protein
MSPPDLKYLLLEMPDQLGQEGTAIRQRSNAHLFHFVVTSRISRNLTSLSSSRFFVSLDDVGAILQGFD